MASYKGHLIGGTVAFGAVYYTTTRLLAHPPYPTKIFFFALICCLLGSLFPDVDTKSLGQRLFYGLLTTAIIATIITQRWRPLAALSLVSVFPMLVHHRGIMHSIWFVLTVPLSIPLVIWYQNPSFNQTAWLIYGYFVAGAISHLFLDYGVTNTFKRSF